MRRPEIPVAIRRAPGFLLLIIGILIRQAMAQYVKANSPLSRPDPRWR